METLFIGKNLLFLLEVESTNTYAMNMLRNVNVIEGTVIHTDNQTKGKGQRGAVWHSETGVNITASIVLKPSFLSLDKAFYLSKISALAVHDVLTDILPNSQYDIKIKWPNDILVDKKKIAGILIENNFNNAVIQHSVIGVGLNVNQHIFNDLHSKATSFKNLMNADIDRDLILKALCSKLEKWYMILKQQKFEQIDDYYAKNLYGLGQKLAFIDPKENEFTAIVSGTTTDGKLKLIKDDFGTELYDIKEVKFVL